MSRGHLAIRIRAVPLAGCIALSGLPFGTAEPAAAQELRMAELGSCPLENGEVIEPCVLGYRTVGELNPEGSNAMLPAWGGGTSEQKLEEPYVGPRGWVDPDTHSIIGVDAFGNGVSSSPSNSQTQPGEEFPTFTVRDIVHAQHRLLTEELGLDGLRGVAGISLGGMVAFEWATTYPDFVEKAAPVVGTPRRSAYDLLTSALFEAILEAGHGGDEGRSREAAALFFTLMLRTPEHWNRTLSREDVSGFLEGTRARARELPDTHDLLSHIRAAERFDVTEPFGGSLERAAEAVEAEMLIVVNSHDLLTTPEPARVFAELAGARLHETEGDCGHHAFRPECEGEEIATVIRDFLESTDEPKERIHRARSRDGTEIVGRIRGQGPPLVLVHGGLGDDLGWDPLLPLLERRFTLYLMSTRGRGSSAKPPGRDYALERLVEDVVAFTESIAEPVGLVGYSLGGLLALGAAARSPSVSAVAVYEPPVFEAASEEHVRRFTQAGQGARVAAGDGRLEDAARAIVEPIAHQDELRALAEGGAFDAWAPNVGVALEEMRQAGRLQGAGPTDPSVLSRIAVPVLGLHGSRAHDWHRDGMRHIAHHVGNFQLVEISGVGHFAPRLAPEAVARELIRFFEAK